MFTRGRIFAGVIVILIAAVAYTGYLAYRTERDLRAAQTSVSQLQQAISAGDDEARNAAYSDLLSSSSSAASRTGGVWWGALTFVPFIGDDAGGVRALSTSLATLSSDGIDPLFNTADSLEGLIDDGQVDLEAVQALQAPVRLAHNAVGRALAEVDDQDSSGFLDVFAKQFDDYRDTTRSLDQGLGSAETAVAVLPQLLGSEGPRDYLFVFQNNAEIRASGGLGGAWARIHADAGRLDLREQGAAGDLNEIDAQPVTDLTSEENEIWGPRLSAFFQNPGLTRDFPRSAEIFEAFWDRRYPDVALDGVFALDPVAMSYLLGGTGPVVVGNNTLTASDIVDVLLNQAYIKTSPEAQDALFQDTARVVFETITSGPERPVAFAEGLAQAGREGRLLFAPFDTSDSRILDGARVLGSLSGDDGATPHVDVGVNDITQSKMSYYLRYRSEVVSQECTGGTQRLAGTMTLRQTITPAEAADLPPVVTGSGDVTDKGNQLVGVQIYAPFGGAIDQIRINGEAVDSRPLQLGGRPVADLAVELSSNEDVVVTWMADSGPGQTEDVRVQITPSIVAGPTQYVVSSSCR